MNQEFLYIFILIFLGYLLKRVHILNEEDGAVISKIIFNITLPALVIVSLNTVKIEKTLMMLPFLVILYGLITTVLALIIFKNEKKDLKGTFVMLASGYNVGLFAFPLVEALWGAEGLIYFGMFDVGNSIIVFGLTYIVGSYYSEEGLTLRPSGVMRKFSKSIPFMTYIIMTILNFANIQMPALLIDTAAIISNANMPLSLILLGIYLNFNIAKQDVNLFIKYFLFRYGFGLIFGLLLYFTLPFNQMFRITLLIGFLLPIGLSVIPYSYEFKFKTTQLIGGITNISILISILFIYLFSFFLG